MGKGIYSFITSTVHHVPTLPRSGANAADTLGLNHLSLRQSFSVRLALAVLLIAQFSFGFDQQGYSSTQAMASFKNQFGSYNAKMKKYTLDTLHILGAGRRYGGRMCMFCMSIRAIICATIPHHPEDVRPDFGWSCAKLIGIPTDIYIGMELSVVSIFQSEIVPSHACGFVVGTYQSSSYRKAYMIPYGLFYLVPTPVVTLIWFIPEENSSFLDIFRGSNLRRTLVVCGTNFFLQSTGQISTSLYGALFVSDLGTVSPFIVTVIIAISNLTASGIAMILTDRIGRRALILIGASIQVTSQMTMGSLGNANPFTKSEKAGVVAMMVTRLWIQCWLGSRCTYSQCRISQQSGSRYDLSNCFGPQHCRVSAFIFASIAFVSIGIRTSFQMLLGGHWRKSTSCLRATPHCGSLQKLNFGVKETILRINKHEIQIL
ncbi:sugar transporter, putative [Talaromyces stipitatus ATCC 10500]|uniref:Sugar transporter, putative n=1 Tax=Talaromyces stipitatus (strain ATCC 10500 / CBS 375.48 / QM 6759 / NRRL 1006) TaxID=441959 RepID=B8LTZ3_TALSN|nr:sugar transporter, putative [Talaromyces stipitatus ATCC 10500]EED23823.1 sugar transporter, putative [Talaromyces stipitatus ATCC 10500]